MVLNYSYHEFHCNSLASKQINSLEMVSNEFECEILRGGFQSTKQEVNPFQVANNWYLLFLEIVQDINTVGNSLNKRLSHEREIHQGYGRNTSFDAVDELSSLSSSSSLSETISEDVIPLGVGLGETSTSDSGVTLESDKTQLAFTKKEGSSFARAKESENSHKPPLMTNPSPMHNPTAQVMDRDNVYDPHRINSSVFGRTDSAPTDWSIASNESLFSIQVGNISISREQSLYLSEELERLTQLSKEGELSTPELNSSHELSMERPQPSTIPEVERKIESQVEEANNLEGQKEKETEVRIDKLAGRNRIRESQKHQPSYARSPDRPRLSDASVDSTCSFAFPILTHTDKSTPNSGQTSQFQSAQTWEAAKTSLGEPEPVIEKKRRCFNCSRCPSLSWPDCSSCCSCFSFPLCTRFCACCPKWCQPKQDRDSEFVG